jgi:hypothetical protein
MRQQRACDGFLCVEKRAVLRPLRHLYLLPLGAPPHDRPAGPNIVRFMDASARPPVARLIADYYSQGSLDNMPHCHCAATLVAFETLMWHDFLFRLCPCSSTGPSARLIRQCNPLYALRRVNGSPGRQRATAQP